MLNASARKHFLDAIVFEIQFADVHYKINIFALTNIDTQEAFLFVSAATNIEFQYLDLFSSVS